MPSPIPQKWQELIYQLRCHLKSDGVTVVFRNNGKPNKTHSGYFTSDPNNPKSTLYVDTFHDFNFWFHTFIHEYCHYLQFRNNKYCFVLYDFFQPHIDNWISRGISSPYLQNAFAEYQRIETECEQMTLDMLVALDFTKDKKVNIQKFNATMIAVEESKTSRSDIWNLDNHPSIWKRMPSRWLKYPYKVPKWFPEQVKKVSQR